MLPQCQLLTLSARLVALTSLIFRIPILILVFFVRLMVSLLFCLFYFMSKKLISVRPKLLEEKHDFRFVVFSFVLPS